MKRHFFTSLTLTVSTLFAAVLTNGMTPRPSQAQTNPEFGQLLLSDILDERCDRATEISYRSNQLTTHSENGTRVSVEAILRKIVTPDSPLRQSDTATSCMADSRETSQQQLIIQSPTETRRVTLTPHSGSYLIYHLQSFSPNGQYLIADLQSIYTGGDGGNYITIFDLSGSSVSVSTPNVCEELDFSSYYGFSSETEVVVLCEGYLGMSRHFESVNVETGAVTRLSSTPTVTSYGLAAGEPAVTKIQTFQ